MHRRIGFVDFSTNPGGIGKDMTNLMNAMADAGGSVDMLIHEAAAPGLPFLSKSINVIKFGDGGRFARVRTLARYMRDTKPAAILSTKERESQALVIARRMTGSSARAVIRVGTTHSELLRFRHWWQRIPTRYAIRATYRAADTIICISQGVADDTRQFAGVPAHKIRLLPNTSIAPDIEDQAAKPVAHPWLQATDSPIVLAVGRLVKVKDYPTLMRAFEILRRTRLCRLVILGEGKERTMLQRLVRELHIEADVSMPGYVGNPYAFMKRAALLVHSSRVEGFGNVIAEALAVGTPVVSTDCRHGPREILDNGRFGPLVAVGDVEGLAEAMRQTLDQPHPPEFLRQAADPYRVERIVHRYLDTLLDRERSS
ncbi:MAG: glycosyltransferase [Nitrococcus sp.]|nr:glycosyltransferase [Nitrococcus sp.]